MDANITLNMNVFTVLATIAQLAVSVAVPVLIYFVGGARRDMQDLRSELTRFRLTMTERVARMEALQGINVQTEP